MPGLTENLHLLTPEFALAGLAFAVFAIDLILPEDRKELLAWISVLGLLGLIALSLVMLTGESESLYGGLLAVDDYSLFFKVVFLGMGVFVILSSIEYVKANLGSAGEFYGLILFSILGMNVMAQARELLTAYVALELLSFSLYVLVAYARDNAKSNEAGLKYIIIGAVSSAILLYGVSMVYSVLGVTRFSEVAGVLAASGAGDLGPALWVGLALIMVGLGFKLAAVPFHMWAPDAYEGAPLPVTAYLAIASKAAAFALVLRLFAEGLVPVTAYWSQWQLVLAVLASVTMLVGNLVALAQRNVKRLMAYSSIGHVGFILAGVAALSSDSLMPANGILFYLVGYSITNMLVFAGLIAFFNLTGKEEIPDFAGLADQQPFLAACLAIGLFSLAGLPIFAGFTVKFYLFTAVAVQGFLWLAGLAIFSSLISLYYYLQIIRQMYIERVPDRVSDPVSRPPQAEAESGGSHGHGPSEPHGPPATAEAAAMPGPSPVLLTVLALGLLAVLAVGVYPAPLLDAVDAASRAILPPG